MIQVTDDEFQKMIAEAMDSLPKQFEKVENVAILVEDDPSPQQREMLHLHDGQTLFGLYEGVPLPQRQGQYKILPDKITLFKNPLQMFTNTPAQLQAQVRKTIWHELAHYYGLGHKRIRELE